MDAPVARPTQVREATWAEYVRRIAGRDESAISCLYDESSPLVYGLALRIVRDAADAEEISIDVYTQVWRTAPRFQADRGTVTAWLVMLTRSRAIDRLRTRKAVKRLETHRVQLRDDTISPPPDEWTELFRTESERIKAALEALPDEQRELVDLAFFCGYSHGELSSHLGLPLGTVKTRLRIAILKLRQLLQPLLEGR